ncbi:carbonic anhydrase [Flagelloscypha sp. PMI_526]|nr:carbonic anhydrase [Flagelloscypha sp. PMI_526]
MHAFGRLLALSSAILAVSASCLHGTSVLKRSVGADGKVKVATFGYSGEKGPLNWAGLDQANTACAVGRTQSPIAIDATTERAYSPPHVKIPTVEEAEFENLGSTIEVLVEGTTTFEGKDYELKQFHLHTPSEHRIHEMYYPLEMHMVHESHDGAFLVLAINYELTEDGSTTEVLNNAIVNLDHIRHPGMVTKTGRLDFSEIAHAFKTQPLFRYTGSLTTPPCSEGITFLVMETPLRLNVKNYNHIKGVVRFNSRYSQNQPGAPNLIQIGAQSAQLNCNSVQGAQTSPSHSRALLHRIVGDI